MNPHGELGTAGGIADQLNDAEAIEVQSTEHQLFGQFVGFWSIEWTGRGSNADRASMRGEVHFRWLLGGQAIQDDWTISSGDGSSHPELAAGIQGTTVRFYDPSFDTWRCVWVEPSKSVVRQFYGWREGDDIVLFSEDEKPYVRWNFTEISADSFVILRETSFDNGSTWDLEEEMRLNRMA